MDCNSSLPDDIIPVTPNIQIRKSKKRKVKWNCSDNIIIPKSESETYDVEFINPVYVFHSFTEVLRYNSKSYPMNNRMRIIGQYKTSQYHIPYISGYDNNDKNFTIFLNMKSVENFPKFDEHIEAFGHLEFQSILKKDLPIFVVHFFKVLDGNISNYINNLRRQKIFVPKSCLQLNKEHERVDDSLFEFLHNLSKNIISVDGD